jgi:hypothetical protein
MKTAAAWRIEVSPAPMQGIALASASPETFLEAARFIPTGYQRERRAISSAASARWAYDRSKPIREKPTVYG